MTGATGFREMVRMGGEGDVANVGLVLIFCQVITLVTGYTGLLMLAVCMNVMAAQTL